jgi:hypothetical protein
MGDDVVAGSFSRGRGLKGPDSSRYSGSREFQKSPSIAEKMGQLSYFYAQ